MGNADNPSVRTLKISHPDEQGANHAKQLIEGVLATKTNKSGPGPSSAVATTSVQVAIPDGSVGLCIGRQGSVIRFLQESTNTRIQIPQHVNPGEVNRIATVTGPVDGCHRVQQMIAQIVQEQSSASVMSGTPSSFQHHAPNQQMMMTTTMHQQQQQQQGYSAEWAAYHAAQQQAAATQQQHAVAVAQQVVAAPAPAPATASNEYTEQFFRYAYYYGEEAARQYYGAWSPPLGTPNPYGVNPSGITAAPAAASAPAAAAPEKADTVATLAPAPAAAPPEARETSRRQVSNLPAWMTKK
jgi:far upstream element-binding protein